MIKIFSLQHVVHTGLMNTKDLIDKPAGLKCIKLSISNPEKPNIKGDIYLNRQNTMKFSKENWQQYQIINRPWASCIHIQNKVIMILGEFPKAFALKKAFTKRSHAQGLYI